MSQLVETLHYKQESCWFYSRKCLWKFHSHNPSGHTMALGLTQPLTKLSISNIFWEKRRPLSRADNFTIFMCQLSRNLGASTIWKMLWACNGPVQGLLYLYLHFCYHSILCDLFSRRCILKNSNSCYGCNDVCFLLTTLLECL